MSITRQGELTMLRLLLVCKRDEDGSDRLLFRPALWPGDARDRQRKIRFRSTPHPSRQRPRNRPPYRTVLKQQHWLNLERARLRIVGVSHDAFDEILRRARHRRDALRQQSAGTTLSDRKRVTTKREFQTHDLFHRLAAERENCIAE